MTNYYAIANGNWKNGSKWSLTPGGGAAGAYPISGDAAFIVSGWKITTADTVYAKAIKVDGGELCISAYGALAYAVVLDEIANAIDWAATPQLWVTNNANSKISNLASPDYTAMLGSYCLIKSATASPAHPWWIKFEDMAGEETRSIDLDAVKFQGVMPSLGNDDNLIWFATRGYAPTTLPRINKVPPMWRDGKIDNYFIDGRKYSRIYDRGQFAGAMTIRGKAYLDSFFDVAIAKMRESGKRLSFFHENRHMPFCRIESCKGEPANGAQMFYPFTLTLIEDR